MYRKEWSTPGPFPSCLPRPRTFSLRLSVCRAIDISERTRESIWLSCLAVKSTGTASRYMDEAANHS
ncbi:unnamed protein product, partial [Pylaiella littoralis]